MKVKAYIEFPPSWGYTSESVWLTPNDGYYVLENSPFYAFGYSFKDLIECENNKKGELIVKRRIEWGGHFTYRLAVPTNSQNEQWETFWSELEGYGCTYEMTNLDNVNLYAVDIPSGESIKKIYKVFELGEENGVWEFEEGDIGEWKDS